MAESGLVVFALKLLRTTGTNRSHTYHRPEAKTCFENEDRRDPGFLEAI